MDGPRVIYEDNHCLAVVKPWNMLTQGDATGDPCLLDWAKGWVREKYAKPGRVYLGLLHRLDRPAAGIVLFARTSKAASRLSAQFRAGGVDKTYMAVVKGNPGAGRELIHFLLKDASRNIVSVVSANEGGREARLHYQLLEMVSSGLSLVGIRLYTGRPHQIRVQMSAIGHPLLGDLKYGSKEPLPGGNLALFSSGLSFDHPTLKRRIELKAESPSGEFPWDRFSIRRY